MTSVAVSPKFQVVIPKEVRKQLNILPGQRVDVRVEGLHIVLQPELPMSALRGLCPGIDTNVPNDPEGPAWPGGCDLLAEPVWVPPSQRG